MRREALSMFRILLALFFCTLSFNQLAQAAADGPQPPQFRLPKTVAPVHYSLNLTVAPDQDTFTGAVDIDLNFKEASSVLWLNADKLTVSDATLTAERSDAKRESAPTADGFGWFFF
jgi:aminopeptidase N